MKKTKRLLSLILSGTMLASTAAFTVEAKSSAPKYAIDFVYDVDAKTATAVISVEGGTYGVGHFGLSYDPEVLTLVNDEGEAFNPANDMMADIVIGHEAENEYTVIATEETNLVGDLVDTNNGTILFGWYVDGGKVYIEAEDDAKILATVNFVLADEIAESESPADALKEKIGDENPVDVFDGEVDEDLKGWDEVYTITTPDFDKYESDKDDIDVSSKVSAEMPDITAKASGRTITVSWKPDFADEEANNIEKYAVSITTKDKEGNVIEITGEVIAGEDSENYKASSKRYTISFKEDEGIQYNTKYDVKVTPVTKAGNSGASATAQVTTEKATTVVDKDKGTSTTGASLTYTVTYIAGEGTIPEGQKFKYTVNRNSYVDGSPAVIAPEGKVFAGWSVDGKTLVSVEVYKITKDVVFKAIYVEKEEDTHRPFILGYPGGIVKADGSLTRAEAAAIIARASENFDPDKTYTANFSDVPADHWAANYIAFVYENNIVTGYEDNTYHPSSNITRAEFATIMQRYLGIELNEDALFIDVDKSHWAVAYIGACKNAGLINGYENGEFRPSNSITRAESVKILNRATDRIPTPEAIDAYVAEKGVPFEDLDSAKWYFYEIMEAAFPHLISYYH